MIRPGLAVERECWGRGLARVAGVDEVGVGSLSGAVVAAAVLLPAGCAAIPGVRDSKTLSAAQREKLADEVYRAAVTVGLGAASVAEIERLNVRVASHLAMRRALLRIGPYDIALIDGLPIADSDLGPHRTIVDGDATSYAIACASIVAKVVRDRLMRKLAGRYPAYGWDHNAGYGTAEHRAALQTRGATPYHRRTFAPVRAVE
ncbi:MAG TPA: ribonuclease HII [Chloroflexota bacterium]|nr:ribonuclease HII [Chloroflexota bacterium]